MKKLKKISETLTVILFLLFIFGFSAAYILVPDKTVSEIERRSNLQQFPTAEAGESSLKFILDGSFSDKFGDYLSDQLPLREELSGGKAALEKLLLKRENGNVIFAKDGFLAERQGGYNEKEKSYSLSSYDEKTIEKNLGFMKRLSETCGVESIVAVAPRKADVMAEALPENYPFNDAEEAFEIIEKGSKEKGLIYVDLYNTLKSEDYKETYYKTDHHWTSRGAYLAYRKLGEVLGFTPYDEKDFRIETVAEGFYGTSYSKAGLPWDSESDSIEYYSMPDIPLKTQLLDTFGNVTRTVSGVLFTEYLSGVDKHEAFVGGNTPRAEITAESGEKRETILLIKDSFAHSLAPFLALHYDVVLIDARLFPSCLNTIIEEKNINKVILLENLEVMSGQGLSLWIK